MRRGFTLMELILVMMVVAISAMIAAPKLADFSRQRRLPNAAVDLATTARWCRVQALENGVQYRLNLDPVGGSYWVTKDDGTGLNFTEIAGEWGEEVFLPEGIEMECQDIPQEEDGMYITFLPGGQSDVATISLSSERRTLNITSETPSGLYRVFDPFTERVLK